MLQLECIVRGYLAGQAYEEYARSGTVHTMPMPPGLRLADRLPEPLFTPSTKAEVGHDENIDFAAAAAIVGDNAGYWVGREFGFPLIYRYGHYIRVDEGRLKVAQYLFQRHGGKIVFFGRFVAILRAFAAFLAGVNHLPWPRFLLFNALGGVVWATLFGIGGYFLGFAFEHYARPVGVTALIAAVIGAFAASRFVAHHEQALRAEAEAALPGPLVAPKGR